MLRFIFYFLLCINATVFAYSQGYLGSFTGNEHEPERLKNQLNAGQINLISAAKAATNVSEANGTASASVPAPAAAAVVEEKKTEAQCLEVGNFGMAGGKRFEGLLEPLELGEHMNRKNITVPEATTNIVYIPSQGNKEGADKKASELKQLGITDFVIINDDTPLKWGISLGVFKSETSAQRMLATLIKQGVHSARITSRGAPTNKLVYQVRGVDADTKAKLEKILSDFPSQEMRDCQ